LIKILKLNLIQTIIILLKQVTYDALKPVCNGYVF